MLKYLKTAFLNHWNLLFFLGGSLFALMSGQADFLLPIVLAAEIAYVGLLGSHPKFQAYVDAQDAKSLRGESAVDNQKMLSYILRTLPRDLLQRFQQLRAQCEELRQIASELKQPGMSPDDAPFDRLHATGLDRLLWIHLRLLYTQYALSRFLQKTQQSQLQKNIDDLEKRIAALPPDGDPAAGARMKAALQDNLETSRARLANWSKANENYQLIQLELDRLENKIRSLGEMAVNRQEPEFISSEVDHAASSLMDTERTMNELQFATGLGTLDSDPPSLLRVENVQK
jgi:hypothetical protein